MKEHESEESNLISVVDEDLIDKEFVEDNKILDLKSNFYKGDKKSEEEVLIIIRRASHLNVVGEKIIKLLKTKNLVDDTMSIQDVPYAQIILVKD
ncbi:DUF424 family protein [Bacteroidota bacterium]